MLMFNEAHMCKTFGALAIGHSLAIAGDYVSTTACYNKKASHNMPSSHVRLTTVTYFSCIRSGEFGQKARSTCRNLCVINQITALA